jgi:hypothetical protein
MALIYHIPHSSIVIPSEWRKTIILSDRDLQFELLPWAGLRRAGDPDGAGGGGRFVLQPGAAAAALEPEGRASKTYGRPALCPKWMV